MKRRAHRRRYTLNPSPWALRCPGEPRARDDTLEWNIIVHIRFDHSTALQQLLQQQLQFAVLLPVQCSLLGACRGMLAV